MDIIEQKIREIIGKRADLSNTTAETKLTEIGLDSLDLVETMMEIEEAFGIEFGNEEILGLKIVGDVLNLVSAKKK